MTDIKKLREGIRSLDQKIIELVKERLDLSKQIGEIKAEKNLPVKNYQVEKELIERNEKLALQLGLWPELAEDITKTLIRHSVKLQDEYQSERARKNLGGSRKVTVVGGFGQMGQWLCEFFESFGDSVMVSDKLENMPTHNRYPIVQSLEEVCQESEIIVLATPISTTIELIRSIADIGTKALVFDICSLKSPVLESIQYAESNGVMIGSVHPMFGPSVKLLSGRNIVICETGCEKANTLSEQIFSNTTAKIVKVPLTKHDEYMSYVLGLSHLTNLIFSDVLKNSGISYKEMEDIASTTYNALINVAEPVVNENDALYFEIQAHNHYSERLMKEFSRSFEEYRKIVKDKDHKSFSLKMIASRTYFNESDS